MTAIDHKGMDFCEGSAHSGCSDGNCKFELGRNNRPSVTNSKDWMNGTTRRGHVNHPALSAIDAK